MCGLFIIAMSFVFPEIDHSPKTFYIGCFTLGCIISLAGFAILVASNFARVVDAAAEALVFTSIVVVNAAAIPVYAVFGLAWILTLGIKPIPIKFR